MNYNYTTQRSNSSWELVNENNENNNDNDPFADSPMMSIMSSVEEDNNNNTTASTVSVMRRQFSAINNLSPSASIDDTPAKKAKLWNTNNKNARRKIMDIKQNQLYDIPISGTVDAANSKPKPWWSKYSYALRVPGAIFCTVDRAEPQIGCLKYFSSGESKETSGIV
ncbi:hypothetical protein BD408DRAFT_437102 [Parasitella parasitica]|nr:hypothetical protein BD408DRAFT_437102 [Parasitella parasitica]